MGVSKSKILNDVRRTALIAGFPGQISFAHDHHAAVWKTPDETIISDD